jgi:hypothetical protein
VPLGFAIVSTHTATTSSPRAAEIASAVGGTVVTRTPHGSSHLRKSEKVPPNASRDNTTRAPGRASASRVAADAAWPEAKATAPAPPSRSRMRSANASTVGLCMRAYWFPLTSPAKRAAAWAALSNT